jgi:DNA-binding SARP family transcriptional activator/TolB-like protein
MLASMTKLKATLFGDFTLATAEGTAIRIETRKARALLAILIMARGQPQQRERLAGLLWSRGETRQALASLSQAIYSLRRSLDDTARDAIRADPETVAIASDVFTVDVWDLEAAATQATETEGRTCLELYRGGFLDDLSIDTEDAFSDWRSREHARLEQVVAGRGTALMEAWEAAPQIAEMRLVERLLSIDTYNEAALRVRMILLAREGRQAAAIEAGTAFAELLGSELGISPSDRLAEVKARVRAGEFATDTSRSSAARQAPPGPALARYAVLIAGLALAVWFAVAPKGEPPTDIVRLLVRPFSATGGISPELAQGFSDDLSTELVRRTGLDVLSRESGRMLDAEDDTAGGASHVLHGRLRAENDRWILNTWITEVGTGREVWADRFIGAAGDPRALRDGIAARIADGVGVALLPPPEPGAISLPDAAVPAYLRALSQLHSGTAVGNALAIARLSELADAHTDAIEPRAALVLAYERVAFEAADFAQAAGLHWLEGYLRLKRELADVTLPHPTIQAARARLALRRMDYSTAEALARQALEAETGNVTALEVLALGLALSGDTEAARNVAARVIALSPAAPQSGYTALAMAAFADGDHAAAREMVEAALETPQAASLHLLVLRAALLGVDADRDAARDAFDAIAEAVEDRPFGAWRVGDLAFSNPRAATWRRPSAAEAAHLIPFSEEAANRRLREGLRAAAAQGVGRRDGGMHRELGDDEIEALVFNARIDGHETWLVQEAWVQTRSSEGDLFQDGPFGPLPQADRGRSRVLDGRLCDSWIWDGAEMENCQRVMEGDAENLFFLAGETGVFPFRLSVATSRSIP